MLVLSSGTAESCRLVTRQRIAFAVRENTAKEGQKRQSHLVLRHLLAGQTRSGQTRSGDFANAGSLLSGASCECFDDGVFCVGLPASLGARDSRSGFVLGQRFLAH